MSTTETETAAATAAAQPRQLRFGPNKTMRRRLIVNFATYNKRDWLSISLLPASKRAGLYRSLAFNSAPLADCSLLYGKDEQDDDVSFIVEGTLFAVSRKEAAQLIEAFGIRSRVMDT